MRNTGRSTLRLLHYWWPMALGWSIVVVVQRATGRMAEPHGLVALLAGIVAAYSADRVLDPPSEGESRGVSRLLTGVGLIAAVLCGWAASHLPLGTVTLLPVLGLAALAYGHLKRTPLTKLVLLPLVWTWASMALPFGEGSWFGWHAVATPIAAPLFCLVAAGCLLCDLKDEASDRDAGVRSLPVMAGPSTTIRIAVLLAVAAAGLALLEHRPGIVVSAGVLGLSTLSPGLLATESTGPLLVDVILTLPGILISTRVL